MGGRAVHLTGRQRTLLAALLLDLGRVVSVERLADHLWGEALPPSAPARVRGLVTELRRALGADTVVTRSPGYLIPADAADVDAEEFTALVERARGESGEAAVARYERALALWRGEPFQELSGPAAQAERYRLEELRYEAIEGRAAALLELGRGHQAGTSLMRLAAEQPLRERTHGLLMRALHEAGRVPESLEVYRTFRARLVRELGVEPSAELQRLHQRLLQNDPPEPAPAPALVPRQLPPGTGHFVGRSAELSRMAEGRALIVTGPAGVGKTALAVHWARQESGRFPDGQLFLDMRGFDQREPMRAAEALPLLLQGLGQAVTDIPVELDAQVALYRSLLADRRLLVVLDDVAEPDQVRALLPGGPGCLALITSRDSLPGLVALDGVERLTLDVLTSEEALRLVAQRVGEDRLRREPEAAARLVTLCGRLPLALSIAVSWIGEHEHRTIGHYVRELADHGRLARLRVEGEESVAVRAALDLSYHALPQAARRVFRLLGLAPVATVSTAAAAALAGTSGERARRSLDAAARIHLVKETALSRYAAHDLVLEYAAQRGLAEDSPEERRAAVERLCAYYLRTAEAAASAAGFRAVAPPHGQALPDVTPTAFRDGAEALDWLGREWDNLAATISHAAAEGPRPYAWLLVAALADVMQHLRTRGEGLRLAEISLAAAEQEGDLGGQAAMCQVIGLFRWRLADFKGAMGHHRRALMLSRQARWPHGEALALQGCGVVLKQLGEPGQAIPHYRRAVKIHRMLGDERGEARGLNNLASAHLMLAQLRQAERSLLAGLPLTRGTGDRHVLALTLVNLALVHQKQARFAEALESLREALAVAEAAGLRYAEAVTHETFGWTHREAGHHREAVTSFTRSLEIAEDVDNQRCQIASLTGLAGAELELGRTGDAFAHLDAALELARRTGTDLDEVLLGYAEARHRQGRHDEALAEANRALELALTANPLNLPRLHTLLGSLHLATGDDRRCAEACERALELAARSGQRLEYARAQWTLAHALARQGDERAERHRREAEELLAAIGAPAPRL
ncbi:Regulatory protein AfsR [Nonomuraea coxensis DSM 45129]|uniref:Regulatory protein AfsR n=1 Tax=Nonomuraea coxensis DSM 45129 TaxID=1122611 RepID=A0ABX8U1R7_9ACTN|nr:Regulatory protein AfsR [Nonomuraea coxensis DSM 45129]